VTTGNQDTLTYLGTSTVGGQQVAQYKDKSSDTPPLVTTLSVLLTGRARPIQGDVGSHSLMMAFVWNKPTTVSAPPASEILVLPSSSASS
jgi:hypothetical protein